MWHCFTRRTCECACVYVGVCVCMCVWQELKLSAAVLLLLIYGSFHTAGQSDTAFIFLILIFLLTKCISNMDFYFFFIFYKQWWRCATWRAIDRHCGDFFFLCLWVPMGTKWVGLKNKVPIGRRRVFLAKPWPYWVLFPHDLYTYIYFSIYYIWKKRTNVSVGFSLPLMLVNLFHI